MFFSPQAMKLARMKMAQQPQFGSSETPNFFPQIQKMQEFGMPSGMNGLLGPQGMPKMQMATGAPQGKYFEGQPYDPSMWNTTHPKSGLNPSSEFEDYSK